MPDTANIRKLQVLPSRSADLCFTTAGVIALQNYDHQNQTGPAYIGQPVTGYDIEADLYTDLHKPLTVTTDPRYPGDPNARLQYDSGEIHKALTTGSPAPYLFVLRNETLAAVLDQAIVRREGVYFQRFKHASAIQTAMTQGYPAILNYLGDLETDATARLTALDTAYGNSSQPSVITESTSRNRVSNDYKVTTATQQRNTVTVNAEFDSFGKPENAILDTRVYEGEVANDSKPVQTHHSDRQAGFPYVYTPASTKFEPFTGEYLKSQIADTTTEGEQITKTEIPSFFHPRLDNRVAHKQLLSGLATEKMNQTLASHSAPHMGRIVKDEQDATDLEVRRLQIAFADTYLTSPISGVVTAVFKDLGEYVQPGEPVLRVENDAVVFLVGRIQYFGALRIGQDVVVRATDLFEAKKAHDFPGKVRGIRGHEADDDEWEVLIECKNPVDGSGRRVLPIYYQFDRDTTKIIVP